MPEPTVPTHLRLWALLRVLSTDNNIIGTSAQVSRIFWFWKFIPALFYCYSLKKSKNPKNQANKKQTPKICTEP